MIPGYPGFVAVNALLGDRKWTTKHFAWKPITSSTGKRIWLKRYYKVHVTNDHRVETTIMTAKEHLLHMIAQPDTN